MADRDTGLPPSEWPTPTASDPATAVDDGHAFGSPDTPDSPATQDEALAAERLRGALDRAAPTDDELARLARALGSAWSPTALEPADHASLLDAVLARSEAHAPSMSATDDLGASAAEHEAAADLQRLLAEPRTDGTLPGDAASLAALAGALHAAFAPSSLEITEHAAILARALGEDWAAAEKSVSSTPRDLASAHDSANTASPRGPAVGTVLPLPRRPARNRMLFGATTAALALAASMVLWLARKPEPEELAPLAQARSTTELFVEPFKTGEASARIDRIAMARASDYRDNRFTKWGVR
jgi:hypothetical protein